jgi:hypothetical protein
MQFLPPLLNWRIWAALALAGAGAYLHHMGYESGRAEVQQLFDAYKLQTIEQAMTEQVLRQAKESAMSAANAKVSADYESLKVATGVAVSALDRDRMRLQAALAAYRGSAPGDPQAGLPTDGNPEVGILSECIDSFAALAKDADALSNQVTGLQGYVRDVVKP